MYIYIYIHTYIHISDTVYNPPGISKLSFYNIQIHCFFVTLFIFLHV